MSRRWDITAVLVGRAPQHSRRRECCDGGRPGECGGGRRKPSGLVRGGSCCPNHAPLDHRRAVRHARSAAIRGGSTSVSGRAPGGDFATAAGAPAGAGIERGYVSRATSRNCKNISTRVNRGASSSGRSPARGRNVPIWLLGSSDFSARLAAARKACRFAFASHFAPDYLFEALGRYRSQFTPVGDAPGTAVRDGGRSTLWPPPPTTQRTSPVHLAACRSFLEPPSSGKPEHRCRHPVAVNGRTSGTLPERAAVERMVRCSVVGSARSVGEGLRSLVEATGADELMITSPIFDHARRLRSYEIVPQAFAAAQLAESVV